MKFTTKKKRVTSAGEEVKKLEHCVSLVEMEGGAAAVECNTVVAQRIKHNYCVTEQFRFWVCSPNN